MVSTIVRGLVEVVWTLEGRSESTVGRMCETGRFREWKSEGVMDDESDESTQLRGKEKGESGIEKLVWRWWRYMHAVGFAV